MLFPKKAVICDLRIQIELFDCIYCYQGAIISLLANDKKVHWVRLEESLVTVDSKDPIQREQIQLEITNITNVLNTAPASVFPTSTKGSVTEVSFSVLNNSLN